jgi:hypothetical protein
MKVLESGHAMNDDLFHFVHVVVLTREACETPGVTKDGRKVEADGRPMRIMISLADGIRDVPVAPEDGQSPTPRTGNLLIGTFSFEAHLTTPKSRKGLSSIPWSVAFSGTCWDRCFFVSLSIDHRK